MRDSPAPGPLGAPPSEAELCYRLGAARYPEIRWSWSEFWTAWHLRSEHEHCDAPTEDDFVRLACLENRPGATAVLEREYIEPLRSRIAHLCRTQEATDAAVQELRRKLLLPPTPRLAMYRSSGSFRAWLKVTALRIALDLARASGVNARRQVELHDHLEALTMGPEDHYFKEEWREAAQAALRAAVKRLPDRERFALRMHVMAGWNIDQIGRTLSVHRATVARWLVATKDELQSLFREELAERLGPTSQAVELFLEEMPSRLDLSLTQVFATTGVSAAE